MPPSSTSSATKQVRSAEKRTGSYGQNFEPTLIDRFGVWLSARRILRYTGDLAGKAVGDFGCGFHASFTRRVLPSIERAVLVDSSLAPDLKAHAKVHAIEGTLPASLAEVPSRSLDVVMCISVLEHLWEPLVSLREFLRITRPGGVCLFNVPSWRGKRFLEYSAFRLGLSPREEMDDHKAYYDVRDLWPLLVAAGFRPSNIRCFPHKFGLNTFAVCRVPN